MRAQRPVSGGLFDANGSYQYRPVYTNGTGGGGGDMNGYIREEEL